MDFFAHQDRARASSVKLIVLYGLCLFGVIATLCVGTAAALFFAEAKGGGEPDLPTILLIAVGVGLVVALIIVLATLYRAHSLGGDGANVATMLGGQLVPANAPDPATRRLLNVVEEMALASGMPVPRVFLLPDSSINAFAAGTGTGDAVLGFTRGSVERLSRDELQGVVGHEFSHILNGDMRQNLRLISLTFGMTAVALVGYFALRIFGEIGASGGGRSRSSSSSSNNDSGGGVVAAVILSIVALGLAMMLIGWVGTLFGRLLQAAVSRQREYLADASAVQFTRNPHGIAGALRRIGGLDASTGNKGGRLASTHASEAAHLCFTKAVGELFATHPPLAKRIARVDPSWDGKLPMVPAELPDVGPSEPAAMGFAPEPAAGFVGPNAEAELANVVDAPTSVPPPLPSLPSAGERVRVPAEAVAPQAGTVRKDNVPDAHAVLDRLPGPIVVAAHDAYAARALTLALLLDDPPQVRAAQLAAIAAADPVLAREADRLAADAAPLGPAARLPLLDLSMPALQTMSPTQRADFRNLLSTLAQADARLSPFEFAMFKIVDHEMARKQSGRPTARYASVMAVAEAAATVLSLLAFAGGQESFERSFAAGAARLGIGTLRPLARADLMMLDSALEQLRRATPGVQRRVVDAAAHTVAADGVVRIEEAELLRAVCAAIDVPVPPFYDRAA